MRRLGDLDEEIDRVERHVGRRREALAKELTLVRASARRTLVSPGMLGAAFLIGFVLERLGGTRQRQAPQVQKAGAAGLMAGLAMALARAAMSSANVWAGPMLRRWVERRHGQPHPYATDGEPQPTPRNGPHPADVEARRQTFH